MMTSEDTVIKIDHYTVIKQLGDGSMGKTYLVRNEEDGKILAIKVLRDMQSPWIEKGLNNMGWLNHINILKCITLVNKIEGKLTT
jgi:serine/threonine protein kinase